MSVQRPRALRTLVAARVLVLALAMAMAPAGCASWRAARLYQSGTAALDAGRIELALEELRAAAELAPGASEVHNHLGLAQVAAGEPAAARASFERAVELDCDNVAARRNLARVPAPDGGPPHTERPVAPGEEP